MKNKTKNICPICASASMKELTRSSSINYKGNQFSIESLEYTQCNDCGFEIIPPTQKKRNDCKIRDCRREIDGLLTGAEIKEIRKELGLSQERAFQIFGGGKNAFSKYERGEVVQSISMDRLLRSASVSEEFFNYLLEISGLTERGFKYIKTISEYKTISTTVVRAPKNIVFLKKKKDGRKIDIAMNDDFYSVIACG